MNSVKNFEERLLELAVSIGNNIGCDLLSQTMPLFVEKLNCTGVLVIKCSEKCVDEVTVEGIDDKEQELLIRSVKSLFSQLTESEPYRIINIYEGSADYCVFRLTGFGLLAIRFGEIPHQDHFLKLLPVKNQFARACIISEKINTQSSEIENYAKESSLLHAIIDNLPDPLYVKDNEGRKILLNKAEAELLGVNDISEVLGKKDSDFYSVEAALETEAEDHRIIETGQPVIRRDGRLITGEGKEFWVQGTKIPHIDENGNITGIIGISHNISEYKKIENELRLVAEKYQSIFNSFVDLYYRSDLLGTILEVSPSVYRLSGYKPEELVGKSVSMVYADIESRNRMIQQLIEKGSINDYENLLIHKNGKHVPVSITSHLIKDSEGKPGYIEGTIRDISERKETESKMSRLLKLQNLLTHLATEFINIPVENSNEAVDTILSVIGKGNEIDRVYVYEYDFVKNTMTNTHEWCSEGICPQIENLQQLPVEFFPLWVETHKKGEMLIIDDVSKLDKNDPQFKILDSHSVKAVITIPLILSGECIGFVGFDAIKSLQPWSYDKITFLQVLADLLCNVSDRKKTDDALRNREASLKAVFNNVPYQMWLKDVDSRYLTVNKPFMEYFSIKGESDIIGKSALDIWDEETANHFIEQDKAVMQNRELRSVEELIDFKDKTIWFEIFRAPIVDQNGQLLGTTGIARDITSRKNADKALQEAVAAAEAANEAKSRFLAIMSHEIRNPLNAVVGMVRMLHDADKKGPNGKMIENIKTASDNLLMIINDILDFSKIESGEMVLEYTNFNICDIIERIFNSHTYIAKDKHIEFNCHVDERIGKMHLGDPLRLQQVLSNLISNAIKFTPQGKIELRCNLESESEKTIRVRFEVEDTGIGISPESQERIFEIYKQEDDTISRTHGGSGLGLAISKQIVELMGGKLQLESAKNAGSKFYFDIELQKAESEKLRIAELVESGQSNLLTGCSVLLVEDNKLNQILATTMLEMWKAKVVSAGNGQQAIEILEKNSFDIILMDIQMPVMDGMTTSKIIREKMQITTPILALTANVVKGISEKCAEAGMQGYISKPFVADDLCKKIMSHIAKKGVEIKIEKEEEINLDIVVADVSRLNTMIGSDQAQLDKMINKFLEITPSYLAELNEGVAENNLETIAAVSHKIKSIIDLVSAPVMRDLIFKVNHMSRKGGDLNDLIPLITRFNAYYKLLESQLLQEINILKTA
jgi:PAS domain S-box-containing protein